MNRGGEKLAIYGIGAYWGGAEKNKDKTEMFLSEGVASLGWKPESAPALHQLFGKVEVGDIIYIKSFPQDKGLYVKAVGIVTEDKNNTSKDVGGACVEVNWKWNGKEVIGRPDHYSSARSGALYEETNPEIQKRVIRLLLSE